MAVAPKYKSNSFFNNSVEIIRRPHTFTLEQSQILGDFFQMPFFFRKIFVTTNLEAIRHVLQSNQKNYGKSPAYHQLKRALGNGLVTSEGDFWRRQRRMAQPAFYKTQLEGLFQKMTGVVENYCEELEVIRGKEPIDICTEMMKLTSDIVLKALFSSERDVDKREMMEIMEFNQDHIMQRTVRPYMIPIWHLNGKEKKFKKGMDLFDSNLREMIEERTKTNEYPHDLLSMLMHSVDEETGERMTEKQLRDEAITMYAAGHETSANALNWTFYLLSKHPEVVEKLRLEIREVVGDRIPTFSDIMKLQYTRQVIEEGMRLYPPAFLVGREAKEEDEIIGYTVPKKSIVLVSIYALHRDPQYYENPDEFNPERFAPEKVKERPRLAYMPFGAGPRMCIGNHFALMEMQLILAMLIRQFDFKLLNKEKVEANPLVTLKPKEEILMQVL